MILSLEHRRLIKKLPTVEVRARFAVILILARKDRVKRPMLSLRKFDEVTFPFNQLFPWPRKSRRFLCGCHNYLHLMDIRYNKISGYLGKDNAMEDMSK